ncbi:MAG: GLUG motif-containing protein, partial [Planctomycetota bacterium]
MKKSLFIVFCIILLTSSSYAKYSGGTGEPNDPYRIVTAEDLNDIGNDPCDWDEHFVMVNDINLADYIGSTFNIIGTSSDDPFTGTFDGNDHQIFNFTYRTSGTDNYIGIFGMVYDPNAVIKNVTLIDPDIDVTQDWVGSLVGRLISGTVSDCYVNGGIINGGDFVGGLVADSGLSTSTVQNCHTNTAVSGGSDVGGLVGLNKDAIFNCSAAGPVSGDNKVGGLVGDNSYYNGSISNCYALGNVEGSDDVGGLVGDNNAGLIVNSYAVGNVTSSGQMAGGFVGSTWGSDTNGQAVVSNCCALGNVLGSGFWVGGFAGSNIGIDDSADSIISRCYSIGSASGSYAVAGFVGWTTGTIEDSFWDKQTSDLTSGVGDGSSAGITGKTTAQMQTRATFTDAGWDFVNETINGPDDIWTIKEDVNYPEHVWPLVQYVDWDGVDFLDYGFFANH